MVRALARVPNVGEFVHVEGGGSDPFLSKVLAVTHLAWSPRTGDGYAELHCEVVDPHAADMVFAKE